MLKINLFIILTIIVLFVLLYINNSEHFGATDTLNPEAVRNISSVYNTDNLTATNIRATQKLNISDNVSFVKGTESPDMLDIFMGDGTGWGVNFKKYDNTTVARIQDNGHLTVNSINLLPRGIITAWSGAYNQIPAGWLLCDGSNGTPDLRGRFIFGAGTLPVGNIGGSDTVKLTSDQIPYANFGGIASANGGSYGVFGNPMTTNNPVSIMPPYYTLAWIMKA